MRFDRNGCEREDMKVDNDKHMDMIGTWFMTYYEVLVYLCYRYFAYQPEYVPYIEDCIQEVFFHALRKREKLLQHPNPYAWLANACKKECKNVMRRHATKERILGKIVLFDEQSHRPTKENDINDWIDREDIRRWIEDLQDHLTDSELNVYIQYFVEGKSALEIASATLSSESAIRGALQRIRKKAKRINSCFFMFEMVWFAILVRYIW